MKTATIVLALVLLTATAAQSKKEAFVSDTSDVQDGADGKQLPAGKGKKAAAATVDDPDDLNGGFERDVAPVSSAKKPLKKSKLKRKPEVDNTRFRNKKFKDDGKGGNSVEELDEDVASDLPNHVSYTLKTGKILIVPAQGQTAGPVRITQVGQQQVVEIPPEAKLVRRLYYTVIFLKPSQTPLPHPKVPTSLKVITLSVSSIQVRPGSDPKRKYVVLATQSGGRIKVHLPSGEDESGYGIGTTKDNNAQSIIDLSDPDPDADTLPVPVLAPEQPQLPKAGSSKSINAMYPKLLQLLPAGADVQDIVALVCEGGQRVRVVTFVTGNSIEPQVVELRDPPPASEVENKPDQAVEADDDLKRRLPTDTKMTSYKITYRKGKAYKVATFYYNDDPDYPYMLEWPAKQQGKQITQAVESQVISANEKQILNEVPKEVVVLPTLNSKDAPPVKVIDNGQTQTVVVPIGATVTEDKNKTYIQMAESKDDPKPLSPAKDDKVWEDTNRKTVVIKPNDDPKEKGEVIVQQTNGVLEVQSPSDSKATQVIGSDNRPQMVINTDAKSTDLQPVAVPKELSDSTFKTSTVVVSKSEVEKQVPESAVIENVSVEKSKGKTEEIVIKYEAEGKQETAKTPLVAGTDIVAEPVGQVIPIKPMPMKEKEDVPPVISSNETVTPVKAGSQEITTKNVGGKTLVVESSLNETGSLVVTKTSAIEEPVTAAPLPIAVNDTHKVLIQEAGTVWVMPSPSGNSGTIHSFENGDKQSIVMPAATKVVQKDNETVLYLPTLSPKEPTPAPLIAVEGDKLITMAPQPIPIIASDSLTDKSLVSIQQVDGKMVVKAPESAGVDKEVTNSGKKQTEVNLNGDEASKDQTLAQPPPKPEQKAVQDQKLIVQEEKPILVVLPRGAESSPVQYSENGTVQTIELPDAAKVIQQPNATIILVPNKIGETATNSDDQTVKAVMAPSTDEKIVHLDNHSDTVLIRPSEKNTKDVYNVTIDQKDGHPVVQAPVLAGIGTTKSPIDDKHVVIDVGNIQPDMSPIEHSPAVEKTIAKTIEQPTPTPSPEEADRRENIVTSAPGPNEKQIINEKAKPVIVVAAPGEDALPVKVAEDGKAQVIVVPKEDKVIQQANATIILSASTGHIQPDIDTSLDEKFVAMPDGAKEVVIQPSKDTKDNPQVTVVQEGGKLFVEAPLDAGIGSIKSENSGLVDLNNLKPDLTNVPVLNAAGKEIIQQQLDLPAPSTTAAPAPMPGQTTTTEEPVVPEQHIVQDPKTVIILSSNTSVDAAPVKIVEEGAKQAIITSPDAQIIQKAHATYVIMDAGNRTSNDQGDLPKVTDDLKVVDIKEGHTIVVQPTIGDKTDTNIVSVVQNDGDLKAEISHGGHVMEVPGAKQTMIEFDKVADPKADYEWVPDDGPLAELDRLAAELDGDETYKPKMVKRHKSSPSKASPHSEEPPPKPVQLPSDVKEAAQKEEASAQTTVIESKETVAAPQEAPVVKSQTVKEKQTSQEPDEVISKSSKVKGGESDPETETTQTVKSSKSNKEIPEPETTQTLKSKKSTKDEDVSEPETTATKKTTKGETIEPETIQLTKSKQSTKEEIPESESTQIVKKKTTKDEEVSEPETTVSKKQKQTQSLDSDEPVIKSSKTKEDKEDEPVITKKPAALPVEPEIVTSKPTKVKEEIPADEPTTKKPIAVIDDLPSISTKAKDLSTADEPVSKKQIAQTLEAESSQAKPSKAKSEIPDEEQAPVKPTKVKTESEPEESLSTKKTVQPADEVAPLTPKKGKDESATDELLVKKQSVKTESEPEDSVTTKKPALPVDLDVIPTKPKKGTEETATEAAGVKKQITIPDDEDVTTAKPSKAKAVDLDENLITKKAAAQPVEPDVTPVKDSAVKKQSTTLDDDDDATTVKPSKVKTESSDETLLSKKAAAQPVEPDEVPVKKSVVKNQNTTPVDDDEATTKPSKIKAVDSDETPITKKAAAQPVEPDVALVKKQTIPPDDDDVTTPKPSKVKAESLEETLVSKKEAAQPVELDVAPAKESAVKKQNTLPADDDDVTTAKPGKVKTESLEETLVTKKAAAQPTDPDVAPAKSIKDKDVSILDEAVPKKQSTQTLEADTLPSKSTKSITESSSDESPKKKQAIEEAEVVPVKSGKGKLDGETDDVIIKKKDEPIEPLKSNKLEKKTSSEEETEPEAFPAKPSKTKTSTSEESEAPAAKPKSSSKEEIAEEAPVITSGKVSQGTQKSSVVSDTEKPTVKESLEPAPTATPLAEPKIYENVGNVLIQPSNAKETAPVNVYQNKDGTQTLEVAEGASVTKKGDTTVVIPAPAPRGSEVIAMAEEDEKKITMTQNAPVLITPQKDGGEGEVSVITSGGKQQIITGVGNEIVPDTNKVIVQDNPTTLSPEEGTKSSIVIPPAESFKLAEVDKVLKDVHDVVVVPLPGKQTAADIKVTQDGDGDQNVKIPAGSKFLVTEDKDVYIKPAVETADNQLPMPKEGQEVYRNKVSLPVVIEASEDGKKGEIQVSQDKGVSSIILPTAQEVEHQPGALVVNAEDPITTAKPVVNSESVVTSAPSLPMTESKVLENVGKVLIETSPALSSEAINVYQKKDGTQNLEVPAGAEVTKVGDVTVVKAPAVQVGTTVVVTPDEGEKKLVFEAPKPVLVNPQKDGGEGVVSVSQQHGQQNVIISSSEKIADENGKLVVKDAPVKPTGEPAEPTKPPVATPPPHEFEAVSEATELKKVGTVIVLDQPSKSTAEIKVVQDGDGDQNVKVPAGSKVSEQPDGTVFIKPAPASPSDKIVAPGAGQEVYRQASAQPVMIEASDDGTAGTVTVKKDKGVSSVVVPDTHEVEKKDGVLVVSTEEKENQTVTKQVVLTDAVSGKPAITEIKTPSETAESATTAAPAENMKIVKDVGNVAVIPSKSGDLPEVLSKQDGDGKQTLLVEAAAEVKKVGDVTIVKVNDAKVDTASPAPPAHSLQDAKSTEQQVSMSEPEKILLVPSNDGSKQTVSLSHEEGQKPIISAPDDTGITTDVKTGAVIVGAPKEIFSTAQSIPAAVELSTLPPQPSIPVLPDVKTLQTKPEKVTVVEAPQDKTQTVLSPVISEKTDETVVKSPLKPNVPQIDEPEPEDLALSKWAKSKGLSPSGAPLPESKGTTSEQQIIKLPNLEGSGLAIEPQAESIVKQKTAQSLPDVQSPQSPVIQAPAQVQQAPVAQQPIVSQEAPVPPPVVQILKSTESHPAVVSDASESTQMAPVKTDQFDQMVQNLPKWINDTAKVVSQLPAKPVWIVGLQAKEIGLTVKVSQSGSKQQIVVPHVAKVIQTPKYTWVYLPKGDKTYELLVTEQSGRQYREVQLQPLLVLPDPDSNANNEVNVQVNIDQLLIDSDLQTGYATVTTTNGTAASVLDTANLKVKASDVTAPPPPPSFSANIKEIVQNIKNVMIVYAPGSSGLPVQIVTKEEQQVIAVPALAKVKLQPDTTIILVPSKTINDAEMDVPEPTLDEKVLQIGNQKIILVKPNKAESLLSQVVVWRKNSNVYVQTALESGITRGTTNDEQEMTVVDMMLLKPDLTPPRISEHATEAIKKHLALPAPTNEPEAPPTQLLYAEKQIVQSPRSVLITAPACTETLPVKVIENGAQQAVIVPQSASIEQERDSTVVTLSTNCKAHKGLSPLPEATPDEKIIPIPKDTAILIKPDANERKDSKAIVTIVDQVSVLISQEVKVSTSLTKEGAPLITIDLSKSEADKTVEKLPSSIENMPLAKISPELTSAPAETPPPMPEPILGTPEPPLEKPATSVITKTISEASQPQVISPAQVISPPVPPVPPQLAPTQQLILSQALPPQAPLAPQTVVIPPQPVEAPQQEAVLPQQVIAPPQLAPAIEAPQPIPVVATPAPETISDPAPIKKLDPKKPKVLQIADQAIQDNHIKVVINRPPTRVHVNPGKGSTSVTVLVSQEDNEQLVLVPIGTDIGHNKLGHIVVNLPDEATIPAVLAGQEEILKENLPLQRVVIDPSGDPTLEDLLVVVTQVGKTFTVRGSPGYVINKPPNMIRVIAPSVKGLNEPLPDVQETENEVGAPGVPGQASQLLQAVIIDSNTKVMVQPSSGPTQADVRIEQGKNAQLVIADADASIVKTDQGITVVQPEKNKMVPLDHPDDGDSITLTKKIVEVIPSQVPNAEQEIVVSQKGDKQVVTGSDGVSMTMVGNAVVATSDKAQAPGSSPVANEQLPIVPPVATEIGQPEKHSGQATPVVILPSDVTDDKNVYQVKVETDSKGKQTVLAPDNSEISKSAGSVIVDTANASPTVAIHDQKHDETLPVVISGEPKPVVVVPATDRSANEVIVTQQGAEQLIQAPAGSKVVQNENETRISLPSEDQPHTTPAPVLPPPEKLSDPQHFKAHLLTILVLPHPKPSAKAHHQVVVITNKSGDQRIAAPAGASLNKETDTLFVDLSSAQPTSQFSDEDRKELGIPDSVNLESAPVVYSSSPQAVLLLPAPGHDASEIQITQTGTEIVITAPSGTKITQENNQTRVQLASDEPVPVPVSQPAVAPAAQQAPVQVISAPVQTVPPPVAAVIQQTAEVPPAVQPIPQPPLSPAKTAALSSDEIKLQQAFSEFMNALSDTPQQPQVSSVTQQVQQPVQPPLIQQSQPPLVQQTQQILPAQPALVQEMPPPILQQMQPVAPPLSQQVPPSSAEVIVSKPPTAIQETVIVEQPTQPPIVRPPPPLSPLMMAPQPLPVEAAVVATLPPPPPPALVSNTVKLIPDKPIMAPSGAVSSGIVTKIQVPEGKVPLSDMSALQQGDKPLTAEEAKLVSATVAASNTFAFKLYNFVRKTRPNILFAPMSISVSMSVLLRGANGATAAEIHKALGFADTGLHSLLEIRNGMEATLRVLGISDSPMVDLQKTEMSAANGVTKRPGYDITLLNSMWIKTGGKINSRYVDDAHKYFNTQIRGIDFNKGGKRAADILEKWIRQETQDKLTQCEVKSEQIEADTDLMIINSLHLNAAWDTEFKNSINKMDEFYIQGLFPVSTPFMQKTANLLYKRSPKLQSQIVEMRFQRVPGSRANLVCYLIVPNKMNNIEVLGDQLAENPGGFLSAVTSDLKLHRVNLHVPIFQANEAIRVDRILPFVGIRQVFNKDTSELPFVSAFDRLHVDKIVHESRFEFNKRGTGEQSDGTTGSAGKPGSAAAKDKSTTTVTVDRPFMYLVVDKTTGAIIYIGRLSAL